MQEHEALTKLLGFEAGSTPHWGAPSLSLPDKHQQKGGSSSGEGLGEQWRRRHQRHHGEGLHQQAPPPLPGAA
ncbi:MAG: hypothetical protein OXF25_09965 [Cyanobacteria bacterium MAG CAR3_bin_5]|nr:hypothetical protein [Cyanobacteria bacterium MAG CAR3_bin_5]